MLHSSKEKYRREIGLNWNSQRWPLHFFPIFLAGRFLLSCLQWGSGRQWKWGGVWHSTVKAWKPFVKNPMRQQVGHSFIVSSVNTKPMSYSTTWAEMLLRQKDLDRHLLHLQPIHTKNVELKWKVAIYSSCLNHREMKLSKHSLVEVNTVFWPSSSTSLFLFTNGWKYDLISVRKSVPIFKVLTGWNDLPNFWVSAQNPELFKKHLLLYFTKLCYALYSSSPS